MFKKICVLGLGYIGLPTSSLFATHGLEVIGVDVFENVVNTINKGQIHIEEPGLKTVVKAAVNSGNLKAKLEPEEADAFIIAVPTPFKHNSNSELREADMSYVESATRAIMPYLKKGDLVILESTSPVKTTEDLICPLLEETGLKIGEDIFVAHCPERVLPGKILKESISNDRVIGGINKKSAEMASSLYRTFVEGDIYLTTATTAEMCKLMENTYRDVNIALANELANICTNLGINAWDVIEFANKHPRVNVHSPGPGVGGHCISVDPWFIVEKFPEEAKIIKLARQINDNQPHRMVGYVKEIAERINMKKITILGITYKGNVDDIRESPALEIIRLLKEQRSDIELAIYDPHVKESEYELADLETAFDQSDLVLILANHNEFKYLSPNELGKIMRNKIIFDTRKCIDLDKWKHDGFETILIGS